MANDVPDWRDVYDERHAPSAWWSEPRASETRATVEREAQREQWRKARAALAADQRRNRHRRSSDPYKRGRTLGVRVRPADDQVSE